MEVANQNPFLNVREAGAILRLKKRTLDNKRWMGWMAMPRFSAHWCTRSLIYSGPVSNLIASGVPRHSMIWSSARVTRVAASEKSTSMPNPSWLKSSTTLSVTKHLNGPHY